jgi:2-oxoglutarate dehydrogenase complex dehydrogenase (E1) component-like enzyme
MGAWSFAAPLIEKLLRERPRPSGLAYAGRQANPSPSFGNTEQHNLDQARIIAEALGVE